MRGRQPLGSADATSTDPDDIDLSASAQLFTYVSRSGAPTPEPVIFFLQPRRAPVVIHAENGRMEAEDLITRTVRGAGGRPLTVPPLWVPDVAPGWTGSYSRPDDRLRVTMPAGHDFYDGTVYPSPGWCDQVAAAGTVVLVTGPFAAPTDIASGISHGRALQTRIAFRILETPETQPS